MFEKALGDLVDRTAADRFDAGDREEIGDEVTGGVGIGAGERGQHTLVFRRPARGGERQPVEIVGERGFAVEVFDQAALPRRCEIERGDEGGEQPHVADANLRRRQAVESGRLEPKRQHFGVGRRLVMPGEGLDPGLHELGGGALAMAKHRSEIAEAGRLAGPRRLQIGARDRNGEIGPQAQFAAVGIAGKKQPPADVLAREVEKRLRRLQDRRIDLHVAGAHIGGDEFLCVGVRCVGGKLRHLGAGVSGGPLTRRESLFDEDLPRAVNADRPRQRARRRLALR